MADEKHALRVQIPQCPTCGRDAMTFAAPDFKKNVYRCYCGTEHGHPLGAPRYPGHKDGLESAGYELGMELARRHEEAFWKAFLGPTAHAYDP